MANGANVSNRQLFTQLEKISETLETMERGNIERDMKRAELIKTVEEHDKMLNGNGTPGLKTSVALLQDQMGRLIAANIAVASVVGVQLVAIVFGLLTHSLPGFTP